MSCEITIKQPRVTRRGALGSMAALTATTVAAATMSSTAFASSIPAHVKLFSGRYAVHGGSTIQGIMAAPRSKSRMDVVVLLHDANGFGDAVRQAAVRYASAGYLVVAPDLRASFGRSMLGVNHDGLIAAAIGTVPNLAKLALSSGKVSVVRLGELG